MSGVHYLEVSEDEDGQRLDRFLQKHLKGTPFGLLQKLMRKGQIRVDSKRVKAATRLASGQKVRIPPLEERKNDPKKYRLSDADQKLIRSLVLYDDGDIVAINKPAGLATQGGTNIKRHIDGMLDGLLNEKDVRPRLIHRLDKDTSGILLLARSADMARQMGKIFQGHQIRKIYWALCVPAPEINTGEIRAPIRKAGAVGQEKMIVDIEAGQEAWTLFDIVERAHKQLAFVAFWPRTGRTHQIRVHANHMGCPIIGDGKYGGQDAFLDGMDHVRRVHLHARSIRFTHPKTNKLIELSAPLADDLQQSWKDFGFDPQNDYTPFADIKKF
jgi:23S rRNA pseudouridine955/2504/2580 synthase